MQLSKMVMFLLLVGLAACSSTASSPTKTPAPPPPATLETGNKTATALPATTMATPAPSPTPFPTETIPPKSPNRLGNPDLDFAQVQFVRATQSRENIWRFDVTVRHNDQGWDHYSDLWEVVDLDGNKLAERVLLHPHDAEQPFTRSQSGIQIPPQMSQVIVRAKCNVHGFGGQEVLVDLTQTKGENYEIVREG